MPFLFVESLYRSFNNRERYIGRESYRAFWRTYYPAAVRIHSRYVNESDRSECVIIHARRDARYTRSPRGRKRKISVSQVGQLYIGTGGIYGDFIICESTIISWTASNEANATWAREREGAKEGCDCNSGCVFLVITRGARRVTFRHRIILAAGVRDRVRVSEKEKGMREEEGHSQKSRTWRAQRRHALARPDMYIFPANILRCRTNVPRNPCDDSARARALADKGRQKAEMRNANGIPFSALSSFTGSCKKIETRLGARGRSREGETGTAATVFAQS